MEDDAAVDDDIQLTDDELTDEELTALALAADPDAPIPDDAVPLSALRAAGEPLLPEWYMPASPIRARRGWRSRVSISLAVGLMFSSACGICVTNGFWQIF